MLGQLRRWLREIFGLVPVLDLHGLGVKDAIAECETFLREAQAAGVESVRVVYGKGRGSQGGVGVLRLLVPRWFENEGSQWVARYERLLDASGNDGSARVWLRPNQTRSSNHGDTEARRRSG